MQGVGEGPQIGSDLTARRVNPRDKNVGRHFLDFLVANGHLERMAADRASQAQRETGERIDVVVTQLGLLTEDALVDALSRYFQVLVMPKGMAADASIVDNLPFPLSFLRENRLLPVSLAADTLTVATADPFATDTLASVAYFSRMRVRPLIASARWIESELSRLYDPTAAAGPSLNDDQTASPQSDDVQRLRDIASEAPIIRLVNRLITSAVQSRASDIHVEPLIDGIRIRHRIDGVMVEIERLPMDTQAAVASRIKILARLNIAERRLPQDGRAKFVVAGRELDLRVSTSPQMHGESIVLRILDREAVNFNFSALGFEPPHQSALQSLLSAPNGIILVTGPTGSGKTTTLYAGLSILNSADKKLFTVEDPIEYQLPGVNQIQVKAAIGLDFVHCLRSILRQDPDVVMIGEMRDLETARTGIQASLTGHLVLSTLHTNSAAASITRLMDMGVEDFLLASTISAIVAQRLVRKLCSFCKQPARNAQQTLDVLDPAHLQFASRLTPSNPHIAVGCQHCRGTGYHGRTTIAEILVVDSKIRRKIVRGTTDHDIEAEARGQGMETLFENGLRKVMASETTLEEVLRVARM
jgi:general secretion pathway protein E